jgi:hypothetical protein
MLRNFNYILYSFRKPIRQLKFIALSTKLYTYIIAPINAE